jgi:hypothetical protein
MVVVLPFKESARKVARNGTDAAYNLTMTVVDSLVGAARLEVEGGVSVDC